jgi:hypothetical protein
MKLFKKILFVTGNYFRYNTNLSFRGVRHRAYDEVISLKFLLLYLFIPQMMLFAQEKMQLVILDQENLVYSRNKILEHDASYLNIYKKLCMNADSALQNGPFSVVTKKALPPSGDIHDFMSLGPYWWPDTTKPDGLPYIRRDGIVNPERNHFDNVPLYGLDTTISTLSLAYFYSGEEKYAQHTASLIRTWFLDEITYMNPNLRYGQAIRGKVDGRGIGIIDTRAFIRVAEAIGLIAVSDSWSDKDQAGMEDWFNNYLDWLLNSDFGIDERNHKNNHGTWFDVLATSLAIFTGRDEVAKEIISQVPEKRITVQIDAEGKQAYELDRTRAYHYSMMNLAGLFQLALIAEKYGIDLWSYQSENGSSLRVALEYLVPFAMKEKKWPYQMIRGWEDDIQTLSLLLRIAAQKYNYPLYEKIIQKLPGDNLNSLKLKLLYPVK